MTKKRVRSKARRRRTYKYPSTEVQGPGSHVEFKKPSWGDIREAVEDIREKTQKVIEQGGLTIVDGRAVPKGGSAEEIEDTLSETLRQLAIDSFVGWDWVDDDEEPLPPLPDVSMDDLMGDEVEFIFSCVQILYKMTDEEREGK